MGKLRNSRGRGRSDDDDGFTVDSYSRESAMVQKVSLVEKFSLFSEQWSPKVVGEVNDCHVRLAKIQGEFVWHHHEHEDELFFVVKGRLLMKLRDGDVWVEEGEFIIVPRGVEHLPVAERETHLLLVEPKGTVNTGNVGGERTIEKLDRI